MNSLIIIGNGFDLAHGLKTSYPNFIDWFWETQKNKMESSGISSSAGSGAEAYVWFKGVWDNSRDIRIKINEIEELKRNSFLGKISDKSSLENWVDIENEYYQTLISCKYASSIKQLNNEFSFIQNDLEKYLKFETGKEVKPIDKIKEHLDAIFNPIINPSLDSNTTKSIMFLNFNYTKVEDIYLNTYYEAYKNNIECIHIHGELSNLENPIIFGYGDELDDNYHRIEGLNDNRYLEKIKSIRYLETRNYQKLLSFVDSDDYKVFIMGHSCGSSDRTLLNTLFEHHNCKSVQVFFHKNGSGDNFSDITMNISRNLETKHG